MSIGLAVALVGMTSLALAILLLPLLLRHRSAVTREGYNLAVYRDQLAEVERDVGRGLLTADQGEAARTEISRRILALHPEGAAGDGGSPVRFAVATVAVILVPFAAWAMYAALGAPGVPDQPFADRGAAPPAAATAAAGGGTAPDANAPHDMQEAMTRLAAHLKQQPDDVTGWVLLARSDMSLNRFQEAADAYHHALDLTNNRLDILGDWGEAAVLAAGGKITPEAQQAFEKTLNDPDNAPRSRYYLALARRQQGDAKTALQQWVDLEADSPADADWLPMVRQRITETAGSLGVDAATLKTSAGAPRPEVSVKAPPLPPAIPPVAAAAPPSPSAAPSSSAPPTSSVPDPAKVREAQQALANAPAEDRQAMINSMVERLAARLEQQPDDVDGWARLGRSYMVLNQPAKARDAYARAVKLKPDDPALKEAYIAAEAAAGGK